MEMRLVTLFLALILTLGSGLVFAQGDKGVRVQGHAARTSGKRLALVIGNASYKFAPLRNPVNDARAMTATLRDLGFQVIALENASQSRMKRAIDEFGRTLRKQGGVGLFYFSGHGMQVNGRNYMVPVGASVISEADVEYESVDAGRVLAKMDTAGNGMNIVILDACRNNPFARSFRSATNGLATMDAPSGTLIAYATAPGKVAADGEGTYGLYTGQLIRYMTTPGLTLERVFKKVRSEVRRISGGTQVSWEASSLEGEFYFAGVGAPGKGTPIFDEEEELWKTVRDSTNPVMYIAYLGKYPNGRFAKSARLKILYSTNGAALDIKKISEETEIFLDGEKIGTGPQIIPGLKNGTFELKIKRFGFKKWIKKIDITKKKWITIIPKFQKYKISLFPSIMSLNSKEDEQWPLAGISRAISSKMAFTFSYSYYEQETGGKFFSKRNKKELEEKTWKGFFTKTPNLSYILAKGRDLELDAVILFTAYYSYEGGSSISIYLVDIASGNLIKKTGPLRSGNYPSSARIVAYKAMNEFEKRHE